MSAPGRRRGTTPILPTGIVAIAVAVSGAGVAALPQAPPDTDIWIATLDLSGAVPVVGTPMNATARPGYDNQPWFLPDNDLLYTAQHGEQTDLFRLTPTQPPVAITGTDTSEYSPTLIPQRAIEGTDRRVSTVRVEPDGTQRLWSVPLEGGALEPVLTEIAPVGYHAWLIDGTLALFVLGDPPTLVLVEPDAQEGRTVASDIGRSLHRIPGQDRFSFLQREGEGFVIRAIAPRQGDAISDLGPALPDSQDLAWTPDGRIFMAAGTGIWARRPDDRDWIQIVELEGLVASITRLAVSPDGTRLAIVAS